MQNLLVGESEFLANSATRFWLRQDIFNNFSVDVCEAEVSTCVAVGELCVVYAEEVEDGGMEVVDVDFVFDGSVAIVVCVAVGDAAFDSASGHPHGETKRIVVAAPLIGFVSSFFEYTGAAEFSAPDDEGIFEHSVGVEVGK